MGFKKVNNVKMGLNILRKLYVPLAREGGTAPPELNHLRNEARLRNAATERSCSPTLSWCKDMDTHRFTSLQLAPSLLREENTPCAPVEAPRFQSASHYLRKHQCGFKAESTTEAE